MSSNHWLNQLPGGKLFSSTIVNCVALPDDKNFERINEEVLCEVIEPLCREAGSPHGTSAEVLAFVKQLFKRAYETMRLKKARVADAPELQLFYRLSECVQFHLRHRKYGSARKSLLVFRAIEELSKEGHQEQHVKLREERIKQDPAPTFSRALSLAQGRRRHKEEAELHDLLVPLLSHLASQERPSVKVESHHRHQGEFQVLNGFYKAEIANWMRLLSLDSDYGAFPYCELTRLNPDLIALVLVTRPDRDLFDLKTPIEDQLPPITLLLFQDSSLAAIADKTLQELRNAFRQALGKLFYAVLSAQKSMAVDVLIGKTQKVMNYWNRESKLRVFDQHRDRDRLNLGRDFARNIVKEVLLAKIPGLKDYELFPFDRVILFKGSNWNAADMSISSQPLFMEVLEVATRSKRPQDRERALSALERNGNHLSRDFNFSDKEIVSELSFCLNRDCLYLVPEELGQLGQDQEDLKQLLQMKSSEIDIQDGDRLEKLLTRANLIAPAPQINALLAAMFSPYAYPNDEELEEKLQSVNMPVFPLYDQEGLAFCLDYGCRLAEIPYLEQILSCYFGYLERNGQARTGELATQPPKPGEYFDRLKRQRLIVTMLSFDPRLNSENAKGYMDPNENYTLLLIADRDVGQLTASQWNTQVETLQQTIAALNSQNLRDNRMRKVALADRKHVLAELMNSLIHRVKHELSAAKGEELMSMREQIRAIMADEQTEARWISVTTQEALYGELLELVVPPTEEAKSGVGSTPQPNQPAATLAQQHQQLEKFCKDYLASRELAPGLELEVQLQPGLFLQHQFRWTKVIVGEALKVLLNNALEHAALHAYSRGSVQIERQQLERVAREASLRLTATAAPWLDALTVEKLHDQLEKRLMGQLAVLENLAFPDQKGLEAHLELLSSDKRLDLSKELRELLLKRIERKPRNRAYLRISCHVRPIPTQIEKGQLEIWISNNAEPLPSERLRALNQVEPMEVGQDKNKKASTGIGVFIARTLLKKEIGEGADIQYFNTGQQEVSCVLRLPISLKTERQKVVEEAVESEKVAGVERQVASPADHWLLYVEDDLNFRVNTRRAIQDWPIALDALISCDNRKEALERLKGGKPRISLLDLTILANEKSTSPSQEEGKRVLRRLLELGEPHPPIVILSGSARDEIVDLIEETKSGDSVYEVEPHTVQQGWRIRPGRIYIASHKDWSRKEATPYLEALAEFLATFAPGPAKKIAAPPSVAPSVAPPMPAAAMPAAVMPASAMPASVTPSPAMPAPSLAPMATSTITIQAFPSTDFDTCLDAYQQRNIVDEGLPRETFVAHSVCLDLETLARSIHLWVAHPGMRSLYRDDQDNKETTPLARNEAWKTLLLWLSVPESLWQGLDPRLRYWALPHNILISRESKPIDAWLERWTKTHFGSRGFCSKLRHDLVNKTKGDFKDRLIDKIGQLEAGLVFEMGVWNGLARQFKNQPSEALASLLKHERLPLEEWERQYRTRRAELNHLIQSNPGEQLSLARREENLNWSDNFHALFSGEV